MLGEDVVYDAVPSFWTDQYDLRLEILGVPVAWSDTVERGRRGETGHMVFQVEDGRIAGVSGINPTREMKAVKRLMERGITVDAATLMDQSTELRSLLGRKLRNEHGLAAEIV